MNVSAIRTHKITAQDQSLAALLDTYLPALEEQSVVAISSKIVAITQGQVVDTSAVDKHALIENQSDYFLPRGASRYDVMLTITRNIIIPNAGIDESNGNGCFVLWPRAPQAAANAVRAHLRQRHGRQQIGVIITDSVTTPLCWGVTGAAIAHSGFLAVNNFVGHPDIFGRALNMTKVNIANALAAAAVVVMGEADEQTPLAVLHDLPFVQFQEADPTPAELHGLHIALEDDLYAPLLKSVPWQTGRQGEEH